MLSTLEPHWKFAEAPWLRTVDLISCNLIYLKTNVGKCTRLFLLMLFNVLFSLTVFSFDFTVGSKPEFPSTRWVAVKQRVLSWWRLASVGQLELIYRQSCQDNMKTHRLLSEQQSHAVASPAVRQEQNVKPF